ncbi:hypothetical protein L914_21338 [Phytophthora nicotianae]|uniref:SWIM-type domain-containing protein n=1 Tax=Phytophthora nicotianae TaxID=4792 RepID=W2M660_PHYNI|nr:hypothetical protein L914_21338 [Phytophthora nicotianae]
MLAKASALVCNERNYRKLHRGAGASKRLEAVLFNVRKHMVGSAGILESDVDATRARTFMRSLQGKIARRISAQELEYEVMSLHRVLVGQKKPTERFELSPQWSVERISLLRQYLQCTCESYIRSGWVCAHTLATLSLIGLLDIGAAMTRVQARRAPGRPRIRRSALYTEESENGYFSITRLLPLFLKRSGQPLGWKIVDDFTVSVDGVEETSNFVGQVVGGL